MTCLCKYQFCWNCLEKWKSNHECKDLELERTIKMQEFEITLINQREFYKEYSKDKDFKFYDLYLKIQNMFEFIDTVNEEHYLVKYY